MIIAVILIFSFLSFHAGAIHAVPDVHFVVAPNGNKKDSPMYSYEATQGGLWRENGRIKVGVSCEPSEMRKTDKASYHFVTNEKGVRGIASCRKLKERGDLPWTK